MSCYGLGKGFGVLYFNTFFLKKNFWVPILPIYAVKYKDAFSGFSPKADGSSWSPVLKWVQGI